MALPNPEGASGRSEACAPPISRRASRRAKAAFFGVWHIFDMEAWHAYFELVAPALIELGKPAIGTMRFGLIESQLDCRFSERDGLPFVEFSWSGGFDDYPEGGRGWARVEASGEMRGRIFIHLGDDSGFVARRIVRS